MQINRRSIAAGLTIGVMAGGAGGAIAATTSGAGIASSPLPTTAGATGGWEGYGFGWGGDTAWRDPAARNGWGHGSNIGALRWTSFVRSGRQAALSYLGLSASQ